MSPMFKSNKSTVNPVPIIMTLVITPDGQMSNTTNIGNNVEKYRVLQDALVVLSGLLAMDLVELEAALRTSATNGESPTK